MKCSCTKNNNDPCSGSNLYKKIETKELNSLEKITEAHDELINTKDTGEWVFRGQKCCSWGLKTELERSLETFGPKDEDSRRIEGGLLRLFKRQFRQFGIPIPRENDYMEWLALMRHYGAPTRLLDWTYSFFVALFFAVEAAETPCAVWAFNIRWMERRFEKKYPEEWKLVGTDGNDPNARRFKTFKEVFLKKKRFVINMNSYNQNERLVIQQGTFLCPGDVECSFEENLLDFADGESLQEKVVKFVIPDDAGFRNKILQRLHRMAMNRATLFPGLDGFAQSLKTRLLFPQLLVPDPAWRSWIKKNGGNGRRSLGRRPND